MPKECSICISNKREEIDIDVVNGVSVRDIGRKHRLASSTVGRHRKNCHQAIIQTALEGTKAAELVEAAKNAEVDVTSVSRADEMFRRSRKAVIEAFKRKDYKIAFMGLREARGYLELIAKMNGELNAAESERTYQPMFVLHGDMQIDFGGHIRPAVTMNQQPEIRDITPQELPAETTDHDS